MNITIFATGSRGDVQPYIALAHGLQQHGHRVRLASFADAAQWASEAGIEFFPLAANFSQFLNSESGIAMMETERNLVAHIRAISRFSRRLAQSEGYWESYEKACYGAELVVYSVNAPQGFHLAEKLKLPSVAATYLPVLTPTGSFASPMWPADVRLGGLYNRFTHLVVEQLMWQPFRGMINDWRKRYLNLPPVSVFGPFRKMRESLILYGYSPQLLPKPKDWSPSVEVTGYWFLDRPADWRPPSELVDFLKAGPPPVYIGFGSMDDRHPEKLVTLAVEALQRSRQRGLIFADWKKVDASRLPDNVFKVEYIPFAWLFRQVAAAVHHGGAGTTAETLRAGIPSITVPFYSDQPFWARRLEGLGVAPPPIPRKKLTAEHLGRSISHVVSDTAMRVRALALGRQVGQEQGVQTAVAAIHRHFKEASPTKPAAHG